MFSPRGISLFLCVFTTIKQNIRKSLPNLSIRVGSRPDAFPDSLLYFLISQTPEQKQAICSLQRNFSLPILCFHNNKTEHPKIWYNKNCQTYNLHTRVGSRPTASPLLYSFRHQTPEQRESKSKKRNETKYSRYFTQFSDTQNTRTKGK